MKTVRPAVLENVVDVVVRRGLLMGMIVTLTMLGGCGETEPDPPVATAVSISPEVITLSEGFGQRRQFFAAIDDQYGEAFEGAIAWSGSNPEFFTVDATGLVTTVANGSGTVTVTYEGLSATAMVTVDVNLPPEAVGEMDDVALSDGGGPWGLQPAAFFSDPDQDTLSFTTRLSDTAVASIQVVTDREGHVAVLMTGTAVGTTELTIVATDPGGLSAEQSLVLMVDGEGFTPLQGLTVSNNRIELTGLALVGRCSPPLIKFVTATGFVITINSSQWQVRSDATADWTEIDGTRKTDGTLCPYNTRNAGEYRLVFNMTSQVDEHHEPVTGNYRSENTFTIDQVGANRAPVLSPAAIGELALGSGGGAIPIVAGRFFWDPDGDTLTYTLANTDSAAVSAELTIDSAGDVDIVLEGRAEGESTVTIAATDPWGLSAEWRIELTVEDSDYTPWYAIEVDNGVLIAFGVRISSCMPPVINLKSVDGNIYTVHESKWQTRSDSSEEWSDIDGTRRTDARVCPYSTDDPGDYRVVYEMSIEFDPHVPAIRGWYRSPNFFTVEDDGDM